MRKLIGLAAVCAAMALATQVDARTYYGGGRHTTSHGGHYSGGSGGSSHRGGHYRNVRTSNHYGRHR